MFFSFRNDCRHLTSETKMIHSQLTDKKYFQAIIYFSSSPREPVNIRNEHALHLYGVICTYFDGFASDVTPTLVCPSRSVRFFFVIAFIVNN
jgi:hypothetical protein